MNTRLAELTACCALQETRFTRSNPSSSPMVMGRGYGEFLLPPYPKNPLDP